VGKKWAIIKQQPIGKFAFLADYQHFRQICQSIYREPVGITFYDSPQFWQMSNFRVFFDFNAKVVNYLDTPKEIHFFS